tara:strand:- start:803 stop:2743 length:1941 start_codon:yes stop_codon:yes gene_type:complete
MDTPHGKILKQPNTPFGFMACAAKDCVPADEVNCFECDKGYEKDGDTCTQVDKGSYKDKAGDDAFLTKKCDTGTSTVGKGSTNSQSCHASCTTFSGKTLNKVLKEGNYCAGETCVDTDEVNCFECDKGYKKYGDTCTQVDKGFYKDNTGDGGGIKCGPGTSTVGTGSTSPQNCRATCATFLDTPDPDTNGVLTFATRLQHDKVLITDASNHYCVGATCGKGDINTCLGERALCSTSEHVEGIHAKTLHPKAWTTGPDGRRCAGVTCAKTGDAALVDINNCYVDKALCGTYINTASAPNPDVYVAKAISLHCDAAACTDGDLDTCFAERALCSTSNYMTGVHRKILHCIDGASPGSAGDCGKTDERRCAGVTCAYDYPSVAALVDIANCFVDQALCSSYGSIPVGKIPKSLSTIRDENNYYCQGSICNIDPTTPNGATDLATCFDNRAKCKSFPNNLIPNGYILKTGDNNYCIGKKCGTTQAKEPTCFDQQMNCNTFANKPKPSGYTLKTGDNNYCIGKECGLVEEEPNCFDYLSPFLSDCATITPGAPVGYEFKAGTNYYNNTPDVTLNAAKKDLLKTNCFSACPTIKYSNQLRNYKCHEEKTYVPAEGGGWTDFTFKFNPRQVDGSDTDLPIPPPPPPPPDWRTA